MRKNELNFQDSIKQTKKITKLYFLFEKYLFFQELHHKIFKFTIKVDIHYNLDEN